MAKIPFKAARVAAGFTQESLADAMGVTRQTVMNWENGITEIGTPQFFMFCQLTNYKGEDILLPEKSTKSKQKPKNQHKKGE